MKRPPLSRRRAFTRVDLAVVVFASLIVVGLLQASTVKVREAASKTVCQDNLHNIGEGIHNYISGNSDKLPPMLDYGFYGTNPGWMPFWFSIYPELEANAHYNRARGSDGWAKDNHKAVLKVLLCPDDRSSEAGICTSGAKRWAGTSYAPNYYTFGNTNVLSKNNTVFLTKGQYSTMMSLTAGKGATNQVAVVERFTSFPKYGWSNATLYPMSHSYWGMNPYGSVYGAWGMFPPQTGMSAANAHPYYPNSAHSTCQVLLMDGSVRAVSGTISAKTWQIVCDSNSGDVVPGNWER